MDADKHTDIVREAVAAQNGWKCFLERCASSAAHRIAPKHHKGRADD